MSFVLVPAERSGLPKTGANYGGTNDTGRFVPRQYVRALQYIGQRLGVAGLEVIRGGSRRFEADSARCGLRYTHRPRDRGFSLGVRLAHDAG